MGQAIRTRRNQTVTGASVERNDHAEHEVEPVMTHAGIVRIIQHFMIFHNIFSTIILNPLLKPVKLLKKLLTLM